MVNTTVTTTVTTPPQGSLLEWLYSHGVPGLPTRPLTVASYVGRTVLHHPDRCPPDSAERHHIFGGQDPQTAHTCTCVFNDALGELDPASFVRHVGILENVEQLLETCRDGDPYRMHGSFPQLRRLTIRHHLWHTVNGYPSGQILAKGRTDKSPALAVLRDKILAQWDAAVAANPVDETLLREETVRYAVRQLLFVETMRISAGQKLPVMNALQRLVGSWLGRPVNGTLLEQYYSEDGATLRRLAVNPHTGSAFTLNLLERIDEIARQLLAQDTPTACHVGSPDVKPFETQDGPLPVILWHGIKARRGSVAFGEYPEIVCRWAADVSKRRYNDLGVVGRGSGPVIQPLCESPILEPHQWEIALTLWDDSFTGNLGDDAGPYRDQAAAIRAAAAL